MPPSFSSRWLPLALCLGLAGCQAFRPRNNLQDVPQPRHREPSKKVRTVQVEVTTDASGAVADVRVLRPSGSSALDDFVVESIRSTWPPAPARRTVVEMSHSAAAGFSEPKVLATSPLP